MGEGQQKGEQYDAHVKEFNQRESDDKELPFKARLNKIISHRDSYGAAFFIGKADPEQLFPEGKENYFSRVLEIVLLQDNGTLYALKKWPEEYLKKNNNDVLNMLIDKIKKSTNERSRTQGAYIIIEKGYFFDDKELFEECLDVVSESLEYSLEAVKNWDKKYLTAENKGVFFRLVSVIAESKVYSHDAVKDWDSFYLEMEIPDENKKVFDKLVDSVAKSSENSCNAIRNWDPKYLTGENDWVFAKLFKVVLDSPEVSYIAVRDWNIMYLSPNIVEMLVESVSKDSEFSFNAVMHWPHNRLTPKIVNIFLEKIITSKYIQAIDMIKDLPISCLTGEYQFVFDRLVGICYEDIGRIAKLRGVIPDLLDQVINDRLRNSYNSFNDAMNFLEVIKANKELSLKIVNINSWNNITRQAFELRNKDLFIDFLLDTLPRDKLKIVSGYVFVFLLESDNEEIMKDLMRGGDYQSKSLQKIVKARRNDIMERLQLQLINKMGKNAGGLTISDPESEQSARLSLSEEDSEK